MDAVVAKVNKILKSLDKSLADLVQVAQNDATNEQHDSFVEMECHNVFHRYIRYLLAVVTFYYEIAQSEQLESIRKNMQQLRKIEVLQQGLVHYYDPHRRLSLEELEEKQKTVLGAVAILQRCLDAVTTNQTPDNRTRMQTQLDAVKEGLEI